MDSKNEQQFGAWQPAVLDELRRIVSEAVTWRRNAIVLMLARRFAEALESSAPPPHAPHAEQWTKIESLSQLRAVVGGRFRNLKERWITAGFPLREHRGDRREKANVDSDGWLELVSWISRQGFEVRLTQDDEDNLFEIRPLSNGDI